jgi:hypothetical protein
MSEKMLLDEILPNELEYPEEYFDAQARFALRWAEISDISPEEALLQKTVLFRRLTNDKNRSHAADSELWQATVHKVTTSPKLAAQILFDAYEQQPHARYTPPEYPENDGKHFGIFAFDYYPDNPMNEGINTIKIHFLNTQRGAKSALHPDFATQRHADLVQMFTYIHENHPDAEEVLGGSWLYHLEGYKSNFPEEFIANAKRLVPPELKESFPDAVPNMALTGNSVWGQFVNRNGYVRREVYEQFVEAVDNAKTLADLVEAFPEYPLQTRASVDTFYEFLGID